MHEAGEIAERILFAGRSVDVRKRIEAVERRRG